MEHMKKYLMKILAYYNFPESQTITESIHYIKAKGHTKGNSIVIVENDGLFYMMHGDITYTDEALYENKLSVVFDDKEAARETLNRVREFISNHPTVYLSTHTPLGYENLESKKVVDLSNPPETIPVGEVVFKTETGKYVCSVCGYVYDTEVGDHDNGIPAGTRFEGLIRDFCNKFNCKLSILENGEHYFHTEEQLEYYKKWLEKTIY